MTRINSDLDPKILKRPHLIAEIREITMVPAALRRSLKTKDVETVLKSIPLKFTLNSGHVRFFYNKLEFLINRFNRLSAEMERRGYKPDYTRITAFSGFDSIWYGNWKSSPEDDEIVLQRIALRISQKPHLYKD